MLTLNKVAVTGGLSCGKSSVCRILKELGAHVVSADEIVHQLLSPNTNLGQQIIKLLGDDIVVNGQIERNIIAKRVFSNQSLLLSLEKLLHPAVLDEIERQYQQVKDQYRVPLFVAEIPLLFEVAGEANFNFVIDVWTDPKICRKRFKEATGYEDDEYDKRMARQMSPKEKAKRADYIIENNGSMEEMQCAVERVFNKLVSKSNS